VEYAIETAGAGLRCRSAKKTRREYLQASYQGLEQGCKSVLLQIATGPRPSPPFRALQNAT
jgi:hypothetical protein